MRRHPAAPTRREFLRDSSVLTLGAYAVGAMACHTTPIATTASLLAANKEGKAIEPGLQLYTVRNQLAQNYAGTLEEVAAIGYREVQVTARMGHSPAEVRAMLDANGLRCPSVHLDMQNTVEEEIEAALVLGAESVFLSAPIQLFILDGAKFIGIRDDVDLDTWRTIADEQNERGAKFKAAGLTYGYHNHHFEFKEIDGVLPYDLLLERTDPDLVSLEVDIGWMQVAGADPVAYFDRYPGRFHVCHVKDVLADDSFVDPGQGVVDFQRVFDAAERAGLRHYFVEHDSSPDPMGTARVAFAYLSSLRAY
jgi:sugar phosphate isomerase/epimerase